MFVLFTLDPMLSSICTTRRPKAATSGPLGRLLGVFYLLDRLSEGYRRLLGWSLAHRAQDRAGDRRNELSLPAFR